MIKKKRKVVYSFRTNQKAALEAVAKKDSRTVSNIVGIAIQQFLARRKL